LINNSNVIEGGNNQASSNVETTGSFRVFFPDGTMSSATGGHDNIEAFQELFKLA
jgi:hypothetical protein